MSFFGGEWATNFVGLQIYDGVELCSRQVVLLRQRVETTVDNSDRVVWMTVVRVRFHLSDPPHCFLCAAKASIFTSLFILIDLLFFDCF